MESIEILGRIITNAYYDFQQVRIGSMNRVRDIIRKRIEGINFNEVEKKKDKKDYNQKYTDKDLLAKLNDLVNDGNIDNEEHEYILKCWDVIKESVRLEKMHKAIMEEFVSEKRVYNEFLNKIRGISFVLSANLLKEFDDCSRYDTVSKMWAHCGQNVVNGSAPKRKKGENISYSPKLKSMTWKISDSLLKQNKGFYRKIYDTEKSKQLNREYAIGYLEEKYGKPYKIEDVKISQGHAHNRALRKMRKIFLDHYWHASRELNGLPAQKNYVEGILRHEHIVNWREALEMEAKPL